MKKTIILIAAMLGLVTPAFAASKEGENHFKLYGFIRNFMIYDSHDSKAGTADLYYWTPLDRELNTDGDDLRQLNQFRFVALTSRVGMDVTGYEIDGLKFGAKVETDFYSGLSGHTGTAQLRLRQAYLTMTKDGLGKDHSMKSVLKVGQGWHPMAADIPNIYSLESGAPFGPFSRTPLVQEDFSFGRLSLTAALIWQMQYVSSGPNGASADYIRYGCIPEAYLGVNYIDKNWTARLGVDLLNIKPRNVVDNKKVNTLATSALAFAYLQYKKDLFTLRAKTVYGGAGEHVSLMSGYVDFKDDAGAWAYAPINTSSSWMSVMYGKKLTAALYLGYMKNLGTAKEHDIKNIYYQKNGFNNINSMFRIQPEFTYNIGKFTIGIEYMMTAAQYGTSYSKWILSNLSEIGSSRAEQIAHDERHGLSTGDLHWVANHRVATLVRFMF